jgi:hypothetical protein
MPIELPSESRFKLSTPIVTADGIETIGMMVPFDFLDINKLKPSETLSFRVDNITAGRPDLISERVYGTPQLYWVVIMVNKPSKILRWPTTGSIIVLPTKSVVLPAL